MSLVLLGKIIEDKDIIDPHECLVMLALADATNKETMLCYPSLTRISGVARCTRPTAIAALKRLEKKGWIQIIRRKRPDGVNLANTYRVVKYGDLGSKTVLPPVVKPVDHPVVKPGHYVVKNEQKGSKAALPKPLIREPVREKKTPAGAGDLVTASDSSEPEKTKPGRKPKDQAEFTVYCASRKISASDAEALWDAFEANGWKSKTGPLANWQAAVRNYQRNGWLLSQKKAKDSPPKDRDMMF